MRELLRYDFGREAFWRAADRAETDYLFFFLWNPGSGTILRARAHRPDICLPSAGWRQIGADSVKMYPLMGARIAFPPFHFRQRPPPQTTIFARTPIIVCTKTAPTRPRAARTRAPAFIQTGT